MTSLPEALARFARGHLHSEAEYAVYRTVGGDRAEGWTADEIATHADVDVGDVHRALRRFAAARILVEEAGHGGRQRYRWRSELSYLFDGTSPPGLVDPVCGMPVEAGSPHAATDTTGAAVRFCSAWCRAAFRAGVGR